MCFYELLQNEQENRRKRNIRIPKTPAFIYEVLRQTFLTFFSEKDKYIKTEDKEKILKETKIKSLEGMTDIGWTGIKSTEGLTRRTGWPLILSVFQLLLDITCPTFESSKLLIRKLRLVVRLLNMEEASAAKLFDSFSENGAQMIESLPKAFLENLFSERESKLKSVVKIEKLEVLIKSIVNKLNDTYHPPKDDKLVIQQSAEFKIIPNIVMDSFTSNTKPNLSTYILENFCEKWNYEDPEHWNSINIYPNASRRIDWLHCMELTIWKAAELFLRSDSPIPLIQSNVLDLLNNASYFNQQTNIVVDDLAGKHKERWILIVERRSHALLAFYIAACVAYRHLLEMHPALLLDYKLPVDSKILRQAFTSMSVKAHQACRVVRKYLKLKEKERCRKIFCPAENWRDSIELAESFPITNTMSDYIRADHEWLEKQIIQREEDIRKHKQKIAEENQLRKESEEDYDKAYLKSIESKSSDYWTKTNAANALKSMKKKFNDCKETIKELEEKTYPGIQPNLPKKRLHAQIVTFFMFLPIEFRYVAQSITNVENCLGKEKYEVSQGKNLWTNGRKTWDGPAFPSLVQNAYTNNKFPDKRKYSYVRDATLHVNHPDYDLFFDRGAVKIDMKAYFVEKYIESVSDIPSDGALQWMMTHPTKPKGATTRGNIVYALMNERPIDITTQAYIQIGSLRSFCHLQLLKLCEIIKDTRTPIEKKSIRRLVFQTFGHAMSSAVMFEDSKQFLIDVIEEVIEITPIMHAARLPILSSFLSLLELRQAETLAMECAKKLLQFSKDIIKGIDPSSAVLARCCIINGWALLCFRNRKCLTAEEAKVFLEILVRFRVDGHHVPSTNWESIKNGMEQLIQVSILDVVDEVNERIKESNIILTEMIKIVLDDDQAINWNLKEGHWWEGQGGKKQFHINILKGIVMCNGKERQRLPTNLTNLEDYKQIFMDGTLFEVIEGEKNNVFRTTQEYCQKKFDFYLNGRIDMIDIPSRLTLRLLPKETFAALQLPDATSLCRHWMDDKEGSIFFTEPKIQSKKSLNVKFIYIGNKKEGYRKVPQQYQQLPYHQILEKALEFECLGLVTNDALIAPLLRVESKEFIHILINKIGGVTLEFPRLLLKFVFAEDGFFHSSEYEGYIVSKNQSYFHHIANSLLLTLSPGNDNPEKPDQIILLLEPTQRIVFRYEVHRRFGYLEGATRESRWFLASQLAEFELNAILPQWGMTPIDMCIRLMRQCTSIDPLNDLEVKCVEKIMLCSYKEPILHLVSFAILKFSQLLSFLPFQAKPDPNSSSPSKGLSMLKIEDAWNIYQVKAFQGYTHPRRTLKPFEINMILGVDQEALYQRSTINVHAYIPQIEEKNWEKAYTISDIETKLIKEFAFMETKENDNAVNPEKFLQGKKRTQLEEDIEFELKESLKKYEKQEDFRLTDNCEELKVFCEKNLKRIGEVHKELTKFFDNFEESLLKDPYQSLHFYASHLCKSTNVDRLEFMYDLDSIRRFYKLSPGNSSAICKELNKASIYYGTLCVLEDKLNRIMWGLKKLDNKEEKNPSFWKQIVLNNILSNRVWDASKRPYWIAYEVEQRIQIRPAQYRIATFLIERENRTTQLNMGLGKTRVIIPMMILHFLFDVFPRPIVKIHTLFAILKETATHLSKTLSSSSLNIFSCEMPFHRDVELSGQELKSLHHFFKLIQRKDVRSFIILAREHTQSLILKEVEFSIKKRSQKKEIKKLLFMSPAVNIIDESDAFLQHSIKLMYAVGVPNPLPEGEIRWWTAHRLLTALNRLAAKKETPPEIIIVSMTKGGQTKIEITNKACDNIVKMMHFRVLLLREFLKDPPREMTTDAVIKIRSSEDSDEIIDFIINENSRYGEHLHDNWPKRDVKFILALRGFLARGILEVCLTRKHLVNYGVFLERNPIRRMAIPFEAADVPSLRSEFAHPDVAIVFTLLSYFYTGLTRKEFDLALKVLRSQGPSVQEYYYKRWISSHKYIAEELKEIFRFDATNVNSLDLSNNTLTDELFRLLSYNVEAIGFFLALEIFPTETQQYNENINASAWDSADVPFPLGLSGTNDTHRLLPLPLKHQNADDEIAGTNGMMLYCIVNRTKGNLIVENYENEARNLKGWQVVLDTAIKSGSNVVIDAGALLVGAPPEKFCSFIEKVSLGKIIAIVYFHKGEWMVYDCRTNEHIPKIRSSVHESKIGVFVIFDQAHCRGADLKLHPDAQGLLTLCTGMTKDVLMQAAGRLRQLNISQHIVIFSYPDVNEEILSVNQEHQPETDSLLRKVRVQDVLLWVLENTRRLNEKGIGTWLNQGMQHFFNKTTKKAESRILSQKWDLDMYLPAVEQIEFKAKFKILKEFYENSLMDPNNLNILQQFQEQCKVLWNRPMHFATDIKMSSLDTHIEFCEREIERQQEQMNEKQIETHKLRPYEESPVSIQVILDTNPNNMSLNDLFKRSKVNCEFKFSSKIEILASRSFFQTVFEEGIYFPYTRTIQFFWKLSEKSILLLSDLESDIIYAHILKQKVNNLSSIAKESFILWFDKSVVNLDERIRAHLKLYLGEVKFDEKELKELKAILENCDLTKADCCIGYRWLRHTLMCSDFEKAMQEEESRREKDNRK